MSHVHQSHQPEVEHVDEVEPYVWTDKFCGDCDHCKPGPGTADDVLQRVCYRNPPRAQLAASGPDGSGTVAITFRPSIRVDTPACGDFDPKYATPGKLVQAS